MAYHNIKTPSNLMKYSIIIPAAGIGTRMRSYGPKSLLKLTPTLDIITNQINIINNTFLNKEIILITGFEAAKVMNKTPNDIIKIENERYEETNIVRSIGMGLRAATTDNIIIIHGDLVFNQIFLNQCVFSTHSTIVMDRQNGKMGKDEIGCTILNDKVEHFCYNLQPKWAQVSFFVKKELKLLQSIVWNKEKERLFSFEALNEIITKGGKLYPLFIKKGVVIDIDSSKDLNMARQII